MGYVTINGLSLAACLLAGAGAVALPAEPERFAQVTIRERIIIRVPTRPPEPPAAPKKRTKWREKRGPDCLIMKHLVGASIVSTDHVDLFLRTGQRLRAKLERNCPAIDFYTGFYLKPTKDGRLCADRDMVRTRSGGQCEITAFKRLVPAR
jgi:hypothetical protein